VNGFGRVLLTGGVPADAVGVESVLDSRRHARRGDAPDLFFRKRRLVTAPPR
jgi:hypothetical protein